METTVDIDNDIDIDNDNVDIKDEKEKNYTFKIFQKEERPYQKGMKGKGDVLVKGIYFNKMEYSALFSKGDNPKNLSSSDIKEIVLRTLYAFSELEVYSSYFIRVNKSKKEVYYLNVREDNIPSTAHDEYMSFDVDISIRDYSDEVYISSLEFVSSEAKATEAHQFFDKKEMALVISEYIEGASDEGKAYSEEHGSSIAEYIFNGKTYVYTSETLNEIIKSNGKDNTTRDVLMLIFMVAIGLFFYFTESKEYKVIVPPKPQYDPFSNEQKKILKNILSKKILKEASLEIFNYKNPNIKKTQRIIEFSFTQREELSAEVPYLDEELNEWIYSTPFPKVGGYKVQIKITKESKIPKIGYKHSLKSKAFDLSRKEESKELVVDERDIVNVKEMPYLTKYCLVSMGRIKDTIIKKRTREVINYEVKNIKPYDFIYGEFLTLLNRCAISIEKIELNSGKINAEINLYTKYREEERSKK